MPSPPVPAQTADLGLPSVPQHPLPPGTCDAHTHVFGPAAQFPAVHQVSYAVPQAPRERHLAVLNRLGVARAVLIQPALYGTDLSAILDALRATPERLRGVGVADRTTHTTQLQNWRDSGVRGLRFVDMRDPMGNRYNGSVDSSELPSLAPLMRELGLHANLWAPGTSYAELLPQLAPLGIPLVLDHLACVSAARGVQDPGFQAVLQHVQQGTVWVKLTICRISNQYPGYAELRPFVEALVNANPERLLWGSDWPFLRMDPAPDAGRLIDALSGILGNKSLVHAVLVKNPATLYGFPP